MRLYHSMKLIALSGLVCFAVSGSATAGGLGDTLGGISNGLGNTLGNITGAVGNTVGTVDATVSGATSTAATNKVAPGDRYTGKALLSADAKANILGGVRAKVRVLDNKRLLKLCLSVGGGNGCGSPSRKTVANLIDARIKVLSPKQLLSVCVSVGAKGCGSNTRRPARPAVTAPVNQPDRPTPGSAINVSSRNGMDDDIAITCAKVLRMPRNYEAGLVKLCRKTAAY